MVAPLHWLGVSPLLVYNLTLLAAFVASGMAAYALVRHLTGSTAAALLGGLVFAFAPYRMEHFDHLELQFAFWIPLAVLAWHRAVERDGLADHLKVGALTAGQILSSIYYGIFLVTWLGVITVLWHVRAPRRAARAVAMSLALPLAVLAIYSVPYQESLRAVGERPRADVAGYSARPLDFLSAPANNWLYGRTSRWGANERHLFPGVVALALAVVGLWGTTDPRLRIHGLGLGFALVLALGFNAGLYTLLYDWVLPFRGLRVPARAGILVLLGIAVLAGAGLARILGRARSRAVTSLVATLAIAASVAEYRTSPALVAVDPRPMASYSSLREMPDAVVFEWPVTVPWRLDIVYDVHYMYRSTAALASAAQRLQRQLSHVVSRAVERNAIVSPHVGAQVPAPARRDGACSARTSGKPADLRRGAHPPAPRSECRSRCPDARCRLARGLLPAPDHAAPAV